MMRPKGPRGLVGVTGTWFASVGLLRNGTAVKKKGTHAVNSPWPTNHACPPWPASDTMLFSPATAALQAGTRGMNAAPNQGTSSNISFLENQYVSPGFTLSTSRPFVACCHRTLPTEGTQSPKIE